MIELPWKRNRVYKALARWNVKSNIERQLEFPCCVKLVYFYSTKIHIRQSDPDIVIISAAKRQHSGKSLKIKFKALKELEKGTPHKDVA